MFALSTRRAPGPATRHSLTEIKATAISKLAPHPRQQQAARCVGQLWSLAVISGSIISTDAPVKSPRSAANFMRSASVVVRRFCWAKAAKRHAKYQFIKTVVHVPFMLVLQIIKAG